MFYALVTIALAESWHTTQLHPHLGCLGMCRLDECWDQFAEFMRETENRVAMPPASVEDSPEKSIEVCTTHLVRFCSLVRMWWFLEGALCLD